MNERAGILYRAADGRTLVIDTSWESDGSGMIPPPTISFFYRGHNVDFVYAGPWDESAGSEPHQ